MSQYIPKNCQSKVWILNLQREIPIQFFFYWQVRTLRLALIRSVHCISSTTWILTKSETRTLREPHRAIQVGKWQHWVQGYCEWNSRVVARAWTCMYLREWISYNNIIRVAGFTDASFFPRAGSEGFFWGSWSAPSSAKEIELMWWQSWWGGKLRHLGASHLGFVFDLKFSILIYSMEISCNHSGWHMLLFRMFSQIRRTSRTRSEPSKDRVPGQ